MEAAVRKPNFIKRNLILLVAFLAPVIILLLIYITREIFPFGDQMYLRSDMYHQYAPFLKQFQTILKSGGSLAYSWDIGLGTNFVSTYAYYLASPLNWLTGILSSEHIPEIMSGFIFLKSGLMSAFFAYYLRERFQKNSLLLAGFGTLYAMSGYMAAYSWNVMWLDCLVLLPLLLLGLERLVLKKRVVLYTVTLALSALSNYYIAIMLCIFSVLYFIYLAVCEAGIKSPGDFSKRALRYILYSFLGGLMGAVVYLPALLTLFGTASADSSFPTSLTAYYNLLELFAHGAIDAKVTMMRSYVPNIYAGIAVFALVPLFWLNRKIPARIRAGKTALMALMIFSFSFNIPAFIWHGFHFPNSLPSRQSFIYVFLVLTVAYEALIRVREVKTKAVLASFGAAILAVFALQALYDSEDYPEKIAWISAGFLLLYGILILVYRKKGLLVRFFAVLLLLGVFLAEAGVNTDGTGYGTTSRVNYTEDNQAIESLLSEIPDTDFYRVEKLQRRTKNDGAWSDYRSASIFSSVTSAALSDLYASFGMQSGVNSFSWYGNTPLTSALFSVRYVLSNGLSDSPFLKPVSQKDDIVLYQSKYCLPLGFMVRETTQAEVNLTDENPFVVQNDFLDAAKGLAPVFQCENGLEGETVRYTAKEDGMLFFYLQNEVKTLSIRKVNGFDAGKSRTYSNLECEMILFAGDVKEGDELELTFTADEEKTISVIPAMLDEDALQKAIDSLNSEPLQISSFDDTRITGEVTAAKSGMLFTSIPYEKGWEVYVDGEKSEIKDFYGALIQVPLTKGTHTIEFRYHVPGFLPGLIISLASLFLFLVALMVRFLKKKKAAVAAAGDAPVEVLWDIGPEEDVEEFAAEASAYDTEYAQAAEADGAALVTEAAPEEDELPFVSDSLESGTPFAETKAEPAVDDAVLEAESVSDDAALEAEPEAGNEAAAPEQDSPESEER